MFWRKSGQLGLATASTAGGSNWRNQSHGYIFVPVQSFTPPSSSVLIASKSDTDLNVQISPCLFPFEKIRNHSEEEAHFGE